MNQDVDRMIIDLDPPSIDALEVSGNLHAGRTWRSYRSLQYPAFDLCSPGAVESLADLVICEQVLEHVVDPLQATRTLHDLCRPGGHVIVSTPFLIRVHGHPNDYWRFTADGLQMLLRAAGLTVHHIDTWGNAQCVRGNLRYWRRHRPWHTLRNNPALPQVVWALAQRPGES